LKTRKIMKDLVSRSRNRNIGRIMQDAENGRERDMVVVVFWEAKLY
jgi:hypothetical protein